jgi:hypothetical protein
MAKKEDRAVDRHGYSLNPQNVSKYFWYYEGPRGLQCIYQPRAAETGELLFHAPAWTIPWKVLERSMKRRDAAKKSRRR